MSIEEYIVVASFLLLFSAALLAQFILMVSTDWSTIRSTLEKISYLSWGIYSKTLIKKHAYNYRKTLILRLRLILLSVFIMTVFLVTLFWVIQVP